MVSNALFESEYIFGIHEPGGEELMLEAGKPGWVMFSEALGHDPDDRSSVDYSSFSNRGLGIIVRLNHGYEPDGTLPHSSQYELFARRVANFVATSRGCKIWVVRLRLLKKARRSHNFGLAPAINADVETAMSPRKSVSMVLVMQWILSG